MRSTLAALRTLVLPFGAIVGTRIVLDGVNGRIDIYDSTNTRVATLNASPDKGLVILPDDNQSFMSMEVGTGGTPALFMSGSHSTVAPYSGVGFMEVFTFGSYDDCLRLRPPWDAGGGGDEAELLIAAEDLSAALPPTFRFRDGNGGAPVDLLQIDGGITTADLWFNHPSTLIPKMSLPRGLVDQQVVSSTGSTFSVSSATDMLLNNVPVVAGRTYAIHLHTTLEWNSLNAAAEWDLTFRVNGVNNSTFAYLKPNLTGTTILLVDAIVYWTPSVTANTDDLSVFAGEVVDGASVTLTGSSINHRTLTITDMGVL